MFERYRLAIDYRALQQASEPRCFDPGVRAPIRSTNDFVARSAIDQQALIVDFEDREIGGKQDDSFIYAVEQQLHVFEL